MMTREEVESYLLRMGLDYEEVEDGFWVIRISDEGPPVVANYSPPLLLLRLKVMDLPADNGDGRLSALYRKLLELKAVVVMALAASANWWPVSEADGADSSPVTAQVRITDTQGNAACGALTDGPRGTIQLLTDRGTVELSLDGLASVGPAIDC
jgi:hypothetical protein